MSRLNSSLESSSFLGYLGSLVSILMGCFAWLVDHADEFAKLTGLAAALLGVAAGWYTFRLQRRAWAKARAEDAVLTAKSD